VIKEATERLAKGEDLTTRLVRSGKITPAKAEEVQAKQAEMAGKSLGADGFTRVSIGRLEELVNLVGELLVAQSMVNQDEAVRASTRLQSIVGRQSRIVRDLQNLSLGLRMVPLKATFQKMARAVHDTARKVGKQIDFKLVGEDTEIDRTLAETLADPLLHMVRNAVDHGIESAERRAKAGKPERGNVTLSARQGSDQVIITLTDDGGGMDPKKLIAKAVEKGLIPPDRQLSDSEAYQLIFAAGFSTAEKVTGISGRGVGMDVVRRNVEAAKGRIEIESKIGSGTVFTIRLPLTTAILDAMLLRVGRERFLIPVTSIVASLRPNPGQVREMFGRGRVIENRGEVLSVATLGELFALPDFLTDPTTSVVMVIEHQGGRYAIQVDEILGLQQVVIKPLDQETPHHLGLAGTAILGDGRVGLILDPARLLN
jgi:two-component system chemotaxis sensor kinase CheA